MAGTFHLTWRLRWKQLLECKMPLTPFAWILSRLPTCLMGSGILCTAAVSFICLDCHAATSFSCLMKRCQYNVQFVGLLNVKRSFKISPLMMEDEAS